MKQNHKKIVWTMLAFIILIFGILFLVDANESNFCTTNGIENEVCSEQIANTGLALFLSFLTLLPITLGLFFVRRETFMVWAIFASIAFPLMIGILLYTFNYTDPITHGFMGGPTASQIASVLLPGLFVIISLIIIITKSLKLRKK